MERKEKVYAIANWLMQGYTDKQIREKLGIPKMTYFRWKKRIKEEGLQSVANKKPAGRKPVFEIQNDIRSQIVEWRKKYGWGPTRIEGHLKAHYKTHIPHNQIYRIFVERKLNKPLGMPRKDWGKGRFERTHSMSLLQADFKLIDWNDLWMVNFIDDHSRFIVYSKVLDGYPEMEDVIQGVEKILQIHGTPVQVLTDNGSQFVNNQGNEKTEFTLLCERSGIQHLTTSKKRPSTIGKLENFHGQYDNEAWRFKIHGKYIHHWNYKRPHGALGYLYPCEIFVRDRRSGTTISG